VPADKTLRLSIDVNNPYFRTKVLTASPEELRLLLLEGAVRFMREGRDALARKDYERVYESFTRAKAVIMELVNIMRPEHAPELCSRLKGLYMFIYRLLTEGSMEKNTGKIDQAIQLMDYERETWTLLMERLAEERGGSSGAGAAPAQPPNGAAPGADQPRRVSLSA